MSAIPEAVLVALQRGLPLVPRPFAEAALPLGLSEDQLVDHASRLLADGVARRLGGIFDSRRMGFVTALCGARLDFPADDDRVGELVADPHITHCYERGDLEAVADLQGEACWTSLPNLWFTYGAEPMGFEAGLERARQLLAPAPVSVLRATRYFRTHVILGQQAVTPTPSSTVPADQLRPLTEPERRVVRLLQGHVRPCADLFAQMATEVGMGTAELLAVLRALQDCGRLKRVGLVLRHRSAGYAANAMCAWRIAPDRTEHAGRGLAASPFVTHCYERAPSPQIPFNLYAMMHAHTWREFRTGYGRAVEHLGLDRGVLLCSLREFKKTSPIYA